MCDPIPQRILEEMSADLTAQLRKHHYTQGCIAFIKKQGRDSHDFNWNAAAIATFQAGYDDSETQYKSWHKARFAMSQEA